jgi:hypothetical protein
MAKAELPQVLKQLDTYLQKYGWEITEPYDNVRAEDPCSHRCVLCETTEGCKIVIPNLTRIESRVNTGAAVCANLAQCHKRRKDRTEREKFASEGRLKEVAAKLVFPKGEAGAVE